MNPNEFKTQARADWRRCFQAAASRPVAPPSDAMIRWWQYQMALARFGQSFHGGLHAAYGTSPAAFEAVLGALQNGYEAAAGPHTRTPTFRGV